MATRRNDRDYKFKKKVYKSRVTSEKKKVTRSNIPYSHMYLELSIVTLENVDRSKLVNYLSKYQFTQHLYIHVNFLELLKLICIHVYDKLIIWNSCLS